MYDLAQHEEQRFIDQEFYEDEYDEYLLWTSISPQIMIRVNDPFRVSFFLMLRRIIPLTRSCLVDPQYPDAEFVAASERRWTHTSR